MVPVRTAQIMPADNSSVLVFTFVKASNHVLHNVGYPVAEATHALQQKLKLYRTFALQVRVAKVEFPSGVVIIIAQLQQAHRPAAAIIFDTEHIFHADIVFQRVAHGREYAPVVIQRQITGDAVFFCLLLVSFFFCYSALRLFFFLNCADICVFLFLKAFLVLIILLLFPV